jgi:ectoine hydroxylase-related dioxygenase (phytanoyl-CoA dioxygenase family)
MVASPTPVAEPVSLPRRAELDPTAAAEPIVAALAADGYARIDGLLNDDTVHHARADLTRIAADTPTGRDDFEGANTRRVYALFAKTRSMDAAAVHPVVLAVLDQVLGHYQLSAPTGIAVGAGAAAQPLHPDDAIYPIPRPHAELVVNVMWPLDEFTAANGATRMVPGSHRWVDERPDAQTPTVAAEMHPGAALLYLGSLWHGAGANRTARTRLGVVLHYAVSWLRPVESHLLAVPPTMARTLPVRLQELLGYNVAPPFLGYVDGRHPRRLLDPGAETQIPG